MFNENSIILRILAPLQSNVKKCCCCNSTSSDVNYNEETTTEDDDPLDDLMEPQYSIGMVVHAGDYIYYGYDEYLVLQDHTTSEEWGISTTPALYKLQEYVDGVLVWTPTLASVDTYDTGEKVYHNGFVYESLIDANTVEPGTDDRYWV